MPIFFTKKSCNRGGGTTTPQMPLTVKAIKDIVECTKPRGQSGYVFRKVNILASLVVFVENELSQM